MKNNPRLLANNVIRRCRYKEIKQNKSNHVAKTNILEKNTKNIQT